MKKANQNILVTGATGHQGGAVALELLGRGNFNVRAMVRDRHKAAAVELQRQGAELVEGNYDDRPSLDRALEGVSGVFSVQPMEKDPEAEIRNGEKMADAAKAAGVEHFIYSSVGSADRKTGIPHFESKSRIEEHIRAIGLPHTILRPTFFYFNYDALRPMIEDGILPMPLNPGTKLQQLCEDDYGHIVAEVFERRKDFLGAAREVASVTMTMEETADTFSRVLDREVKYRQAPFDAFEKQAGKEVATMFRWFDTDGYRADIGELEREFGPLTDLELHLRTGDWALIASHW